MAKKVRKDFNTIIHERVRLAILTSLASSERQQATFNEIKNTLDLSAGNLSIQLRRLSAAKYVGIIKVFKDNKPLTTIKLTGKGKKALTNYLETMENILKNLKQKSKLKT